MRLSWAIGAMLLPAIGAASAAAGQPPASAPAAAPSSGDIVIDRLQVPPGVHLSPDMRRRIEASINPGRLASAPDLAWGEARTIDVHGNERGIRLASGAILASRTMALETLQLITDRAFQIGAMHARLPANTPFSVLV